MRQIVRPVASAVAALAMLAASVGVAQPAAAVSPEGDATFVGHGWGHGRGMGQYGALGYAVNYGWGYQQILDHFYGGTSAGNIGNPGMSVELTALNGGELVAIGKDLLVNGSRVGSGNVAIVARLQSDLTTVKVSIGSDCAHIETPLGDFPANALTISTASQSQGEDLIRVCESSGERAYRGVLSVRSYGGHQMTFNELSTEDYLRGVVPRESPASWGSLGDGRGIEALKAQAVAARGYALSSTRPSGARTCDTTACQVYGGAVFQAWSQPRSALEQPATDQAIAATSGEVRINASGAIARTEFSSSTGGYTAGGTFPAVPDLGDSIGYNSRSSWAVSIPLSTVAAKLGTGAISSIVVTQRNGLGADGGRVQAVVVTSAGGASRTFTGNEMRSLLGLNSDWFSVTSASLPESQSVVRALYQDLLGRGPDPTGLAGWSAALVSGTSQSELVGALTRSDEYISLRVAKAYNEVLGRGPDPQGAADWLEQIRQGYGTVDDVQRRFYDSNEYFLTSGGTDAGYIKRLFTTMLRRTASDGDVAFWVGVQAQYGRSAMVDALWFWPDAAAVRAGDYYQTFLGRGPDPEGQAAWAQVLLTYGEGTVRTGIAGSLEYRARAISRYP